MVLGYTSVDIRDLSIWSRHAHVETRRRRVAPREMHWSHNAAPVCCEHGRSEYYDCDRSGIYRAAHPAWCYPNAESQYPRAARIGTPLCQYSVYHLVLFRTKIQVGTSWFWFSWVSPVSMPCEESRGWLPWYSWFGIVPYNTLSYPEYPFWWWQFSTWTTPSSGHLYHDHVMKSNCVIFLEVFLVFGMV